MPSRNWRRSARESSTSSSSGSGSLHIPTATEIRALARRFRISPSKARGQNFVVDPNTARRVVSLAQVEDQRVFEAGAGMGSLTVALAEVAAEVVAVEIDRALVSALREVTGGMPQVRVVAGDALDLDYDDLLGSEEVQMVSNLPYSVATPLVARLLQEAPQVTGMTFMVQREVAERLVATPSSRTYGSVSVLVAYHAEGEIAGRVPPTVFWPRPKVESAIVRLRRRPPPVEVEAGRLMEVVHAAFGQRRKTLRNSLRSGLGISAKEAEDALRRAGIDPRERAERLSLEDFARLAQAL